MKSIRRGERVGAGGGRRQPRKSAIRDPQSVDFGFNPPAKIKNPECS
jgi:hypothetical protein